MLLSSWRIRWVRFPRAALPYLKCIAWLHLETYVSNETHVWVRVRLAAARTKDAVVALELAAGECGSGTQPDLAQGAGTTPCQIADNGRDPTLQFKYSID